MLLCRLVIIGEQLNFDWASLLKVPNYLVLSIISINFQIDCGRLLDGPPVNCGYHVKNKSHLGTSQANGHSTRWPRKICCWRNNNPSCVLIVIFILPSISGPLVCALSSLRDQYWCTSCFAVSSFAGIPNCSFVK